MQMSKRNGIGVGAIVVGVIVLVVPNSGCGDKPEASPPPVTDTGAAEKPDKDVTVEDSRVEDTSARPKTTRERFPVIPSEEKDPGAAPSFKPPIPEPSFADRSRNSSGIEARFPASATTAPAKADLPAPKLDVPEGIAGAVAETPKPVVTTRPATPRSPGREAVTTTRPSGTVASATTKPATTSPKYHVIAPGDMLSSLAARYLGHAKHWQKIADANPGLDPNRLKIGVKIRIPDMPAEPTRTAGPTAPDRSSLPKAVVRRRTMTLDNVPPVPSDRAYTVGEQETWSFLAQRYLGDASLWPELFELNRDRVPNDPRNLPVGTVIELPEDALARAD